MSAPPPQGDGGRASTLGRELKASRRRHGEARYFANDCAEPAVPQAFLHAGEHCLLIAGFHVDDPVGDQPCLGDRWRKKIRTGDAPQDLAFRAGDNAGAEQCGSGTIDCAVAAAGHFMQRAESKAAAGQSRVDFDDSEGKHRSGAPGSAFDLFDLRAQ